MPGNKLTMRLATSLPVPYDITKIVSLEFFTSANKLEETKLFIDQLKNDNDFKALHQMTLERATKADLRGITLAYIAASHNDYRNH